MLYFLTLNEKENFLMVTRVSAEFEEPELAELAMKRIREKIRGVYSTSMIYNRSSDKARKLQNGTLYTIIPTAVTTHNYMTAVIESPASRDVIPEPQRSRKTSVYIVCESASVNNVSSVLNSMGALNISH